VSQATLHIENGKATNGVTAKKSLPLASDLDIENELAKFEAKARAPRPRQTRKAVVMANAQFSVPSVRRSRCSSPTHHRRFSSKRR
jgi:hypothetical protein